MTKTGYDENSAHTNEKASKDLLKNSVNSQHFTSTTDILNSMKDLFNDVLTKMMPFSFQFDHNL